MENRTRHPKTVASALAYACPHLFVAMIRHAYRVSLLSSRPNSGRAYLARAFPLCGQRPAPAPNGLSLGVPVGCGGARRVVHQFEFLAAAVAAAAAAASAAARHVSPVPHSRRQSEASYALNLGRPFGRRPCGPLRHARANALDRWWDLLVAAAVVAAVAAAAAIQPPFGTSRQFLIVVGNTKRPAFRIWNGHFVSDGAGLFGALAPILRIIDRNFGHGSAPRTDHGDDRARSWRRSRSRWFPTLRQPACWPPRLPPSRR